MNVAPLPSPAAKSRSAPVMKRTFAFVGQMRCESMYRSLMSMVSLEPDALFGVFVMSTRKPRNMLCPENVYDAVVPQVMPRAMSRSNPPESAMRFSLRYALAGLWLASSGTDDESEAPSRGCGLAGSCCRMFKSAFNQMRRVSRVFDARNTVWPRAYAVWSSLKPCLSKSPLSRDSQAAIFGKGTSSPAPPVEKFPPYASAYRAFAAVALCTTWMTPTNDVAPYVTGAGPRSTSMRSTSRRLAVAIAGFRAPPHGTPSTTRRNASNSRNPQNSGTALAGPPSLPGAIATPAARASASRSVLAPRPRRSSPLMTSMDAGTSCGVCGIRVATTSMGWMTGGVFGGWDWACPFA